MKLTIRPAQDGDAYAIAALVEVYARRGELLPRSEESIHATLSDWVVAISAGRVVGCGSLVRYTPQLVELRSLAVDENAQGRGIGLALTEALVELARNRGAVKIFALTRAVPFFEKAGFRQTPMASFPEKVWRDCRLCPLQDNCDETAVSLRLVPAFSPPFIPLEMKGTHDG